MIVPDQFLYAKIDRSSHVMYLLEFCLYLLINMCMRSEQQAPADLVLSFYHVHLRDNDGRSDHSKVIKKIVKQF